jgi:glutathione S-transferase
MDQVTLYTNPMSRGRIVRWALEEIGQPYQVELIDYATMIRGPAYLAINPIGKLPAIKHRGVVVSETAAICAYLADTFPEAGLAPAPGSPVRGTYYRWLFFAAGPAEFAITNQSFGLEIPADKQGACGYGNYARALDMLEYAVTQSPYLAGESFSAADIYLGSQIGFGLRFGTIEKRPAFLAYWDRIGTRPAYTRAAEIDDALLAAAA